MPSPEAEPEKDTKVLARLTLRRCGPEVRPWRTLTLTDMPWMKATLPLCEPLALAKSRKYSARAAHHA